MLRLLWRAAPLLWARWKRKAAVVVGLLVLGVWAWPTERGSEPDSAAEAREHATAVGTRVEELGVLPRVSHSWVGGLAAANEADGRAEVYVHWEATKEFDDEDYFMDAGLTRFDGNGATRLERYTRAGAGLAIAGDRLFGSSPTGVFEMARPDGPREIVEPTAGLLGTWRGGLVLVRDRAVLVRSPDGVVREVAQLAISRSACVCGDALFGFASFAPTTLARVDLRSGAQREVAQLPPGIQYGAGMVCARPGLIYAFALEGGAAHQSHLIRIEAGRAHVVSSSRERPRPIAANPNWVFVQRGFTGNGIIERIDHDGRGAPFVTGQGHVLRAVATDRHLVWVGGGRATERTQYVRRAALQ